MDRASWFKQVQIYVGKCFRVFLHEHGWKLFISSAIITVLIAFVIDRDVMFVDYTETRNGVFALVCGCIWIGIFNSIQSICKERDIIKREHRSGLYVSSYVVSHMIFEMVISLGESIIVTAVFCILFNKNLPASGVFAPVFLELWISFFFTIYASDALGLMVSSVVKTPNTAMTVMPFVLIIQLVMSGFIFKLKDFMSKIAYITIAKWSLNGICTTLNVNELHDPTNPFIEAMINDNKADYEFTAGNLLVKYAILAGFIILYGVISIISLRFVDKDKR